MPEATLYAKAGQLSRALTAAYAHAPRDEWDEWDGLRIDIADGEARVIGTDRTTLGVANPGGSVTGDDPMTVIFAGDDAARLVADVERIAALDSDAQGTLNLDTDAHTGTVEFFDEFSRRYGLDPDPEYCRLQTVDWAQVIADRAATIRRDGAAALLNPRLLARFPLEIFGPNPIQIVPFGEIDNHMGVAKGAFVTVGTWFTAIIAGMKGESDGTVHLPLNTIRSVTSITDQGMDI